MSFYPQIYQNWRRKTTHGFAYDKLVCDFLGFLCLSIYSIALYSISSIRLTYAALYNGHSPAVDINDVCFAIHALYVTIIQLCQVSYYDGWIAHSPLRLTTGLLLGAVSSIAFYLITLLAEATSYTATDNNNYNNHNNNMNNPTVTGTVSVVGESWLIWLYYLSYIKIGITLYKYIPQVIMNYQRQCTIGWSIMAVILDILGSVFSMIQLVLDCYAVNDYSGITGDIVKLALSVVSIVFDSVFIWQHFILYPSPHELHHAEYSEMIVRQNNNNNNVFNIGDGISTTSEDGWKRNEDMEL